MTKLQLLTFDYYAELLSKATDFSKYYEKSNFHDHPMHEDGVLKYEPVNYGKEVDLKPLKKLKSQTEDVKAVEADKANCKIIWDTLGKLSTREAVSGELWSYVTHYAAIDFIKERHPITKKDGSSLNPKNYYATYFTAGSRGNCMYENAIGRLWWVGYILNENHEISSDYSFDTARDIFFTSTDVQNRFMGSAILMSYPNIAAGMFRILDTKKPTEDQHRAFHVRLNRAANGKNIHCMDSSSLDKYLEDIYDAANS